MNLQEHDRFHIQQQPTWTNKRYRIFLDDAGEPGELVGFVEQDKKSLKDRVIIYTDEDKQTALVVFEARKLIDMSATFDVCTPEGDQIGVFRKDFGTSLYRSTWILEQSGETPVIVSERAKQLAIMRRAWTLIPTLGEFPFPFRYHFDFTRSKTVVGSVDKTARLSDHYLVQIGDDKMDRRLALAMGVALDARQGR